MKMNHYKNILVMALVVTGLFTDVISKTNEEKSYELDWDSLKTHPTPEWFKDGKFGIYFHWGVYSVPAFKTEWYPHYMYYENYPKWGGDVRPHHVEKYGKDFQYHEFIPQFTAEHFDAQEWAKLFKAAGAKYAGPVAEHSDNFSMWDSRINPWNAAKMGPKRDIVGEMERAVREQGMKFVTTMHHQWHWAWYPVWNGLVDVSTPELKQFYGEKTSPETFDGLKKTPEKYLPSKAFVETWKKKVYEVVDGYKPDMLWFDSRTFIIPEEVRKEIMAHFYNEAAKENRPVVFNYKNEDFPVGTGVIDIEKGRLAEKVDYPWLTDDTVKHGAWCYVENQKPKGANRIIDGFIDIVSKNGCLLLNIGPKADGTIPEDVRNTLLDIGQWLEQNGEAIYESRPFETYGETHVQLKANRFGGVKDDGVEFSPREVRFTTRDDYLYILQLGIPQPNEKVVLNTFSETGVASGLDIKDIQLLGSNEPVRWEIKPDGLLLYGPSEPSNEIALVYRVIIR